MKWNGTGWEIFAAGPGADPTVSSGAIARSTGPTVGVVWIESANTDADKCTFEADARLSRVQLGTYAGLTVNHVVEDVVTTQAFQVGPAGDALWARALYTASQLELDVYEDPTTSQPPPPTGGGGGGTSNPPPGGGTPTTPAGPATPPTTTPTAPPRVVLSGAVSVSRSTGKATVALNCPPGGQGCGFNLQLAARRSGKASLSATKPIGTAKGTLAAGKTTKVKVKIAKGTLKTLRKGRSVKVTIKVTFTRAGTTTKSSESATLKLR
jgi:hypothetical protein